MRIVICFICFFISLNVFCQDDNGDNNDNRPKSKLQTITFESESITNHESNTFRDKKNSVGIGLLSWISGYIPIYYERYLFDFLSIKVGAGPTIRSLYNDLDQIVWQDGNRTNTFGSSSPNGGNVQDRYGNYNNRRFTLGYYLAFVPKIYPKSEALDGFAVYPMLEFKQYNYVVRRVLESELVTMPSDWEGEYGYPAIPRERNFSQKESQRCLDFTINVGGHYQPANHFFVEWRIGAGIRKEWSSRLDIGYKQESLLGYRYQNATYTYTKLKPVVGFDIILGGVF